MPQPLILVSNDDGITSYGIKTLVEIMTQLGEVVVVAPDSPQSGQGHAITVDHLLRLKKTDVFGDQVAAYECSGTPSDCVKLAKHHVLRDRTPDLVVSGINHGSNSSISVLYSGTMSAAIEGAIEGLPAIGFSLGDFARKPDFSHVRDYILQIAQNVMSKGIPKGTALNVNFPAKSENPLKGVKICRQGDGFWKEHFDVRKDPHGRNYFWLDGGFVNRDSGEDSDLWALENNYVSIVPCQYDLTAYGAMKQLQNWNL